MHVTAPRIALVILLMLLTACPVGAQEAAPSSGGVRLTEAFPGGAFRRPVFLTQAPDDSDRFLVLEQDGRIVAVDRAGERTVFLDISDQVSRRHNEEGLLGLAFHPQFATNGRLFVHYSRAFQRGRDRRGVISEFVAPDATRSRADPQTERTLLEVPQPYGNHNGGMLAFGPDGMLYASFGDGGAANDPHGHGQDLGTLLGTILRVDVDAKSGRRPYGIPDDNPFARRRNARAEIWAYGLRNVWRFSFDRETGEMWGAAVGQNRFEEVGILRRGGNHGWNAREGLEAFRRGAEPSGDLVGPLAVCLLSGSVRRLEPTDGPPPPPPFPDLLSETGLFSDVAAGTPVAGALRYGVRSPLWSDGASKERFVVLAPGTAMTWSDDEAFELPVGASVVKSFAVPDRRGRQRLLETRVIRRSAEGFDAASMRTARSATDRARHW